MRRLPLMVLVAVLAGGLIFSQALWAQEAKKIAYVDIGQLFDGHAKRKQYDEILETKFDQYEEQYNEMRDNILNSMGKLSLLKDEEKEKLQEKIDKQRAELEQFERQKGTDLKQERDEKIREILLDIEQIIRDFAEKNKYDIILNDKVLIYGNQSLDVTKEILNEMNK